jgi:hypothetical protein
MDGAPRGDMRGVKQPEDLSSEQTRRDYEVVWASRRVFVVLWAHASGTLNVR